MRILMISDPITPPSYAPRVITFFRYLQEAGHDVVLESGELSKPTWWRFVGDKLWGLSDRQFGKMLWKKYERGRFDVIVCSTYYYFPLWTARFLSRKWDIPYVVDLRDIVEQWGKASYFTTRLPQLGGLENILARWYEKKNIRLRNRVMAGAKAVTTISPWHQQHLQSLTSTPVHLIYNGYDAAELHFEEKQTKTFSVAFIGRIIDLQLRQPQLLLEAVGKMGIRNLSLDFYAEPDKEQEVRNLAQQYGANEYLTWHHYIRRSELNEAMNEASVLVALGCPPQEGQHGILGTKVFEAIGVEKPLLLVPSDEDSLAHLIRETGIGCAANSTEEIIDFIEEKYQEWQANGYTHQAVKDKERFSRWNEAKEMERVIGDGAKRQDGKKAKVSIIVPIYNAEEFLPMCLTSLTHQTYHDLEIILVDDGSTDSSLAIAQQFAEVDERICVIHQANQGQGVARNAGLEVAQGEYIVFVDADDYLDYDFVERHLSAIGTADYVQSGYRRVEKDGTVKEEKLPKHRWQFTSACMRLYRRELIQALRFEKGVYYEDVIWSVDILLRHPRVKMLPYVGYHYLLNPTSTTSVPHRKDQAHVIRLLKQRPFTGLTLYTYFKLRLYWLLEL